MRIAKLAAAVIGVPLMLGSFALAVAGGVAVVVPDDQGWISTGPVRMSTDSAALVGDDIEIDFGTSFVNGRTFVSWDEIPAELEITSRNDKSVFIGIGAADDVHAFLDGIAFDRVTSFDDDYRLQHVRGTYQAPLPSDTPIWVASSEDGLLEWDIQSGDWAIVALNADGSPGIDIGVSASAKVPFLTGLGVVLIALGVVGMTAGGFLTYYGVRRSRDQQLTAPSPPTTNPVTAT